MVAARVAGGEAEASTELPPSANPSVHQLGVQTPGGCEATNGVEWTP